MNASVLFVWKANSLSTWTEMHFRCVSMCAWACSTNTFCAAWTVSNKCYLQDVTSTFDCRYGLSEAAGIGSTGCPEKTWTNLKTKDRKRGLTNLGKHLDWIHPDTLHSRDQVFPSVAAIVCYVTSSTFNVIVSLKACKKHHCEFESMQKASVEAAARSALGPSGLFECLLHQDIKNQECIAATWIPLDIYHDLLNILFHAHPSLTISCLRRSHFVFSTAAMLNLEHLWCVFCTKFTSRKCFTKIRFCGAVSVPPYIIIVIVTTHPISAHPRMESAWNAQRSKFKGRAPNTRIIKHQVAACTNISSQAYPSVAKSCQLMCIQTFRSCHSQSPARMSPFCSQGHWTCSVQCVRHVYIYICVYIYMYIHL